MHLNCEDCWRTGTDKRLTLQLWQPEGCSARVILAQTLLQISMLTVPSCALTNMTRMCAS